MYPPVANGSRTVASAEDQTPLKVVILEEHALKIDPLLERYEDQFDETVEVIPLAYEALYGQLSLALTQRSNDFDVVSLDDAWIPQFASFLLPVELSRDKRKSLVTVTEELARFPSDAPPCGVPWTGDCQFFALRPEWLASQGLTAPTTWDETIGWAAALDASSDVEDDLAAFGLSTLTPHQVISSFLPILLGFGKQLIDPETSVPQLDTPAALEAITVFEQLARFSPEESAGTGDPTNVLRFQQGTVAMMSNFFSSSLLEMRSIDSRSEAGPTQCSLQPAQPGLFRSSMPGVWFGAIPVGSLQSERAERFVEWLVDGPTQRALVEQSLPPTLTATYVDRESNELQPMLPQLLTLLSSSTPRPRSPYYPQLELLVAAELRRLLDQEVDGAEALRNANLAMRAFLAREGLLDA